MDIGKYVLIDMCGLVDSSPQFVQVICYWACHRPQTGLNLARRPRPLMMLLHCGHIHRPLPALLLWYRSGSNIQEEGFNGLAQVARQLAAG